MYTMLKPSEIRLTLDRIRPLDLEASEQKIGRAATFRRVANSVRQVLNPALKAITDRTVEWRSDRERDYVTAALHLVLHQNMRDTRRADLEHFDRAIVSAAAIDPRLAWGIWKEEIAFGGWPSQAHDARVAIDSTVRAIGPDSLDDSAAFLRWYSTVLEWVAVNEGAHWGGRGIASLALRKALEAMHIADDPVALALLTGLVSDLPEFFGADFELLQIAKDAGLDVDHIDTTVAEERERERERERAEWNEKMDAAMLTGDFESVIGLLW